MRLSYNSFFNEKHPKLPLFSFGQEAEPEISPYIAVVFSNNLLLFSVLFCTFDVPYFIPLTRIG